MTDITKDVFISYRRDDNMGVAREITKGLEKRGFSVFFDTQDILPGKAFPDEIENAVKLANDFVIIVSQSYFGYNNAGEIRILDSADWCRHEIELALEYGKRIVPIVLDRSFFQLPSKRLASEKAENVNKIGDVFNINYLEYSRSEDPDLFVKKLETSLSEESLLNSRKNYYRTKLISIWNKNDSSTINIDLRKLVLPLSEDTIKRFFIPILDSDEPVWLQFCSYYAVFTFYRRLSYQNKISTLIEKYADRFNDIEYPLNNVIKAQHYLFVFSSVTNDPKDLDRAVFYSNQATCLLPENSGVLVNFAELVAIACKSDEVKYAKCIKKATLCIRHAMELNVRYPKHYYILGLLEGLSGEYDRAISSITNAIDLEDSESKDAFIRIAKYYDAIHDIKLKKLEKKIVDMIEKEMKRNV